VSACQIIWHLFFKDTVHTHNYVWLILIPFFREFWPHRSPDLNLQLVFAGTTESYSWYRHSLQELTLSWPAGHIRPTYKESFQVRWDNSIPLFLRAAIYLEVSLFRWTSQNAVFHETAAYKWYCVQCCMQHCSTEKKWDTVIPADLKRLFVSGTYMSRWSQKG